MRKFLHLLRIHPESESGKCTVHLIEIPDWPASVTDDAGNSYCWRGQSDEYTCSWYTVEHRPMSRITLNFKDGTYKVVLPD